MSDRHESWAKACATLIGILLKAWQDTHPNTIRSALAAPAAFAAASRYVVEQVDHDDPRVPINDAGTVRGPPDNAVESEYMIERETLRTGLGMFMAYVARASMAKSEADSVKHRELARHALRAAHVMVVGEEPPHVKEPEVPRVGPARDRLRREVIRLWWNLRQGRQPFGAPLETAVQSIIGPLDEIGYAVPSDRVEWDTESTLWRLRRGLERVAKVSSVERAESIMRLALGVFSEPGRAASIHICSLAYAARARGWFAEPTSMMFELLTTPSTVESALDDNGRRLATMHAQLTVLVQAVLDGTITEDNLKRRVDGILAINKA